MNGDRLGHTIGMALVAVASIYASDAGAQARGCASRFSFCAGCDTFTTISVQTGKVCTIRYRTGGAIFGQKIVAVRTVEFTVPRMRLLAPIGRMSALSAAIRFKLTLNTSGRGNVLLRI